MAVKHISIKQLFDLINATKKPGYYLRYSGPPLFNYSIFQKRKISEANYDITLKFIFSMINYWQHMQVGKT